VDGGEGGEGEGGSAFTRRAVLGAAIAVPVAAGIGGSESARPSPPKPSAWVPPLPRKAGEEKWRELFRAFRRSDLARERFQEASSAKAYGPGRRPFHEQEALDERFGEVVEAADEAMLKLLEAPAPDLEALAEKISLIGDHLVWELDGGEECMVWLEADARRLAGACG
jgi:hypothetical protein